MSEPILRIEGLRKSFGTLEVLKGVNLQVRPGEVVVVIGPSGCGKSTLLRCVNYLEQPTGGRVLFCGETVGCSRRWGGEWCPGPSGNWTNSAPASAWSSSASTCSRT
jgi:polar amino acid transport system ATP-binding protein